MGELFLPTHYGRDDPTPHHWPRRVGSTPQLRGQAQWPRLTNSTTMQKHILGLRLFQLVSTPSVTCLKILVLRNDSGGIPMTRDNRRLSKRSLGEGQVIVCQRP